MHAPPSICDSKSFDDLKLDDRLIRAVAALGWRRPSSIQAAVAPLVAQSKDIIARARTGSGKTGAYALPVLNKLLQQPSTGSVKVLILVPSRELVEQSAQVLQQLTRFCAGSISVTALSSDQPLSAQRAALVSSPHVIVSTPSRAKQLIDAQALHITSLQFLILDEADLLLSYGYEADMHAISRCLPSICHTILLSATLNAETDALKQLVLHNPVTLKLQEEEEEQLLAQYYIACAADAKFLILYALIKLRMVPGKCIIFVNSIDTCYQVKLFLDQFSIRSAVLNAELPRNCRLHTVREFNRGHVEYIIATDEALKAAAAADGLPAAADAADDENGDAEEGSSGKKQKGKKAVAKDKEYGVARGVDFQGADTVINFELPCDAMMYLHRIGRTARGGNRGSSLALVSSGTSEEATLATLCRELADTGRPLPAALPFAVEEVQGFTYRVKDAMRNVTRKSIKRARIAEIEQELLKSSRLKSYFDDNPVENDLLLKGSSGGHPVRAKKSLASVPDYLVPAALKAALATARHVTSAPGRERGGGGDDSKKRRGEDPARRRGESGENYSGWSELKKNKRKATGSSKRDAASGIRKKYNKKTKA